MELDKQQANDIKELTSQIQRLLFLIDNDPATGRKGLFHTVEDHTLRLRRIEDRKMFERGVIFVLGAAGTFVFWIVQMILK